MTQQIPISRSRQTLPCFCFFVLFFFLKRSYWSKFHVNIITSSRVMAIFFYNGLTRNLEIENTPIRNLSYIWRLGQVGNTKFVTNVSNEMLLNAAKCQVYSFSVAELLRENQQGLEILPHVHSTSSKFSLHLIHIFRADWMFLKTFGSSDPSFSRSILTLLYLPAPIAVLH